jgi:hypothetical protein
MPSWHIIISTSLASSSAPVAAARHIVIIVHTSSCSVSLLLSARMSKVPAPPFPFPDRWEQIVAIQAKYGERFWLPIGSAIRSSDEGNSNTERSCPREVEVEELLVVNSAWVKRLADTVERLGDKRKYRSVATSAEALPEVSAYLEQRERAMQAQALAQAAGMCGGRKQKTARQLKKSARKRPPRAAGSSEQGPATAAGPG